MNEKEYKGKIIPYKWEKKLGIVRNALFPFIHWSPVTPLPLVYNFC